MKKLTASFSLVSILIVVLGIFGLLIILYLPYRPTQLEAINEVVEVLKGSHFGGSGSSFHVDNLYISQVVDIVPRSQLVIAAYDQVDSHTVARCFTMRYVTKNLILGTRNYSAPGGCQTSSDGSLPMIFHENYERGTYAMAGIITDETVAFVQASWSDGTIETVPVDNDIFLFFHQYDDMNINSIVGLDAQMHPLKNTQTETD